MSKVAHQQFVGLSISHGVQFFFFEEHREMSFHTNGMHGSNSSLLIIKIFV